MNFKNWKKQLQDEVNESKKRKEGAENGTYNKVSGCNGIKNNDGVMITNNNEEIINEVSDSYKNELTSSSGKIVENEVFNGDKMKINSGDENIEIVSESERVMGVVGGEGV